MLEIEPHARAAKCSWIFGYFIGFFFLPPYTIPILSNLPTLGRRNIRLQQSEDIDILRLLLADKGHQGPWDKFYFNCQYLQPAIQQAAATGAAAATLRALAFYTL